MVHFPNSFADEIQLLNQDIGTHGNAALANLQAKGYVVATGLTRYYAGAMGVMGQQHHIREYCAKDGTTARFATEASTEKWLKKGGGRGVFLLLRQDLEDGKVVGYQLAGYGWTGMEPHPLLSDHPITSAFRLGENALGQHLSGDFVQVVISGTNTLYAPGEGIGLETWRSNYASSLYQKLGFKPVLNPNEAPELRPTLDPNAENGMVLDTRLYMGYPPELLV